MRAVIVGAGIGGLAAAIALRRVGVDTVTIEQASSIREIGAGLSLWANALNALRELGVEEKVLASGSIIERMISQTPAGKALDTDNLSEFCTTGGAPCVCIHRGVLQRILLQELPPGAVRIGAHCTGFERTFVRIATRETIEGDILIGCDGISSAIRAQLHGTQSSRYAGYTCWRGIYPAACDLPERSSLVAMGRGSQFGLLPCGAGQTYWFLTRNAPPGTRTPKSELTALFRGWADPVRRIIEGTPEDAILQNDIIDRPPLRSWGQGRATLLGDAAHATTPNLGQGACQALEDAVVLADAVRRFGPCEEALRSYEQRRIQRTAAVVRDSWQTGRILQLENPFLEALRNRFTRSTLGKRLAARMFRDLLNYQVPSLRA